MAASSSGGNDQPEEDASELIFPKGNVTAVFVGHTKTSWNAGTGKRDGTRRRARDSNLQSVCLRSEIHEIQLLARNPSIV